MYNRLVELSDNLFFLKHDNLCIMFVSKKLIKY
jgi:hypothetical protein